MEFFETNLFIGLSTIFTGLVAGLVYWITKRSQKKDATHIIISEIRNAELSIKRIKETKIINDYTSILPVNSWATYKHLFVKDLDVDEFRSIDDFYLNCFLSEKQVAIYNNFNTVSSEERAKIIQHKLLELADIYKGKGNVSSNKEYMDHKNQILEIFHTESYWYEAYAPKNKVLEYINSIEFILNSRAGEKLTKMSMRRI
jgi:hypothetical protein